MNEPHYDENGQLDEQGLWRELSLPTSMPPPSALLLVLTARGIPGRLVHGMRLLVPDRDYPAAMREIALYLDENRPQPARPTIDGGYTNTRTTLVVLSLVGIFHNLTYLALPGPDGTLLDWLGRGNAEAGRILAGEWWRAVTALTLHADGLHLAGNLLIGSYFVWRLCRMLGSGLGWSLILWSGIAGNLVNALLQSPDHRSVGASTALFGAIGAAGMLGVVRRQHSRARNWLLPLAGAAGLLAMLGAGDGEGLTDIGAHLFGFGCGLGLGYLTGRLVVRHGLPGKWLNRWLALAAATVPIGAWALALLH